MNLGKPGTDLIKRFEGCEKRMPDGRFAAYLCPAGVPTIGFGSTGHDIKMGMVWTQAQCDARFAEHVADFAATLTKLIGNAPTTQNQFDAMCSLIYNIGQGNFAKSSVLRLHKAEDYEGAAKSFGLWNKGGGKVLAGLTTRRAAEAQLYRKG